MSANTERKRKLCKILEATVSDQACADFSYIRSALKQELEADGHTECVLKHQKKTVDHGGTTFLLAFNATMSSKCKQDASIIIQKSRQHHRISQLPSCIHPNPAMASGMSVQNLFSSLMRRHANSSSIRNAPVRGSGSQKHLQTTRCEAVIAVSEMATRVSNSMFLALLQSELRAQCNSSNNQPNQPKHVYSPACPFAASPSALLELDSGTTYVYLIPSLHFSESSPVFLAPHDLLSKVVKLAHDELNSRVVTARIPQSTLQLDSMMTTLASKTSDGSQIWRALAIVQYLSSTKQGLNILSKYNISRFASNVAHVVCSFARFVVSNRARREVAVLSEARKTSDGVTVPSTDQADPNALLQDMSLSTLSASVSASRMKALSRRAQKLNSTHVILRDADDQAIYTGTGLVSLLEFMGQALVSQQASFLRLLVSEKTAVSKEAGSEILSWQLSSIEDEKDDGKEDGKEDGGWSEIAWGGGENADSLYEASESVEQASRDVAVALRASMLKLFIQPATESPTIMWRRVRSSLVGPKGSGYGRAATAQDERSAQPVPPPPPGTPITGQVESTGSTTLVGILHRPKCTPLCNEEHQHGDATNQLMACTLVHFDGLDHASVSIVPSTVLGSLAPFAASPRANVSSRVGWCPLTTETDCFGAIESLLHERTLEEQISEGLIGGRAHRAHSMATEIRNERLEAAVPHDISGVARSVIVLRARVRLPQSVLEQFQLASSALAEATQETNASGSETAPMADAQASQTIASKTFEGEVEELKEYIPNVFAVGMIMQDSFKYSMAGCCKPRPSSLFFCAPHCKAQVDRQKFSVPSVNTNCLLCVTDLKFDRVEPQPAFQPTGKPESVVEMAVGITVAGHNAIPLNAGLKTVIEKMFHATTDDESCSRQLSHMRQFRSLLFMGAVQGISLARTSNATASRQSTVSVSNTHRITNPDNHRHMFNTLSQLYVVGHVNNVPMFVGSPWEGCYGTDYQTGVIGDVGIGGQNITSDARRVPSFATQEHVDALAIAVAQTCCVGIDSNTYCEIPFELQGTIRACYAGIHTCLNPLVACFELLRHEFGIQQDDTVMSIQCLPISPLCEAVQPATNGSMDEYERAGTEFIFDDSTSAQTSIMGPYFETARVRACTLADNPYESIEDNLQTCVMIASVLGAIQSLLAAHFQMDLRMALLAFFREDRCTSPVLASLVVDVFVLFCCLFPVSFDVGDIVIPVAAQMLPRLVHHHGVLTLKQALSESLLSKEDASEAMEFVFAITQDVVWARQAEFIACICALGGNYTTVLIEDRREVQEVLERWCKSVWHVHQALSLEESPIYSVADEAHVIARDLMPVFVDRPSWPERRRQKQRGALIGISGFGFIQICTLLNAASTIKGTRVSYARNEGGAVLRPSSFALKGEMTGENVSNKSISPVQSENDTEAYGTPTAKKQGAARQKRAFEANNILLLNVTRHVSPPLPKSIRIRGSRERLQENIHRINSFSASGQISSEELQGLHKLAEAAEGLGVCG